MIEKCSVMSEKLKDWDFLKKLPQEILGFKLASNFSIKGQELLLATYKNENHCALNLIYTEETGDFAVVKNIGLNRFKVESLFSRDKEHFAKVTLEYLEKLLKDIELNSEIECPYAAKVIGLNDWHGWENLPEKIGKFQFFIKPDRPLKYLNGSYILIDYSDFESNNQLIILFNEYRNEIYGEIKNHGINFFTKEFDCVFEEKKTQKILDDFSKNLLLKIEKTISEIENLKNS